MQTAEGTTTKVNLVGSLRLVVTDDAGQHHTYVVPRCVLDQSSPVNILGVPALGGFFKDFASSDAAMDGTTIKSGATKSHFVWDHGRHERHFVHGSTKMPELYLYVGHGYFNAFCTRVCKVLGDKVH